MLNQTIGLPTATELYQNIPVLDERFLKEAQLPARLLQDLQRLSHDEAGEAGMLAAHSGVPNHVPSRVCVNAVVAMDTDSQGNTSEGSTGQPKRPTVNTERISKSHLNA